MSRSVGHGSPILSLTKRRFTELATCELLLLENYPFWTLILPVYILSFVADSRVPIPRVIRHVVRKVRTSLSRSFGLRVLTVRSEKVSLYGDLDSVYHIASEYMKGRTVRLLSPHDRIVLDLGAHYGIVTVRLAKLMSPMSSVIAVEAHPSNYKVLTDNVELNRLANVKPLNFAVAQYTGTTIMVVHDGISTHYTLSGRYEDSVEASKVPCYRLQDIVDMLNLDHVDLVKMDIEGLELPVLLASLPALANRIAKIDIEVHQSHDLPSVIRLLETNDYRTSAERAGILSNAYRVLAERMSQSK